MRLANAKYAEEIIMKEKEIVELKKSQAKCSEENVVKENEIAGLKKQLEKSMSYKAINIDLLMIGRTGVGKSALGNTILNRKVFISRGCNSSVTEQIQNEVSEFKGRVIKVVDGPGLCHTALDSVAANNLFIDAMTTAISINSSGYHAFLLVFRYGVRFTADDEHNIYLLKKVFGKNFLKDFCILVFTCGDVFEYDNYDETGKTFEEWCGERHGEFRNLFQECNNRVLLFDNRTKDEWKRESQLDALIDMVDQLTNQGHRYNYDDFENTRVVRERFMVEDERPMIHENIMRETRLIIEKLQIVEQTVKFENRAVNLHELLNTAKELYNSIKTQDKGTGVLLDLLETVQPLITQIQVDIKLLERIAQ